MATITTPSAGDAVTASWGSDVADAINDTHDDRLPFVNAIGLHASTNQVAETNLAVVAAGLGGAMVIPFYVPTSMELVGYSTYQTTTSTARSCEFALYKDTGTSTLERVTGSEATDSFTPTAAGLRRVTLTSGNITLPPGMYWLCIRNTSTSVVWKMGHGSNTADWSDTSADNNHCYNSGSVAALGATLDVSGFSANNKIPMARLDGAVFGASTRF